MIVALFTSTIISMESIRVIAIAIFCNDKNGTKICKSFKDDVFTLEIYSSVTFIPIFTIIFHSNNFTNNEICKLADFFSKGSNLPWSPPAPYLSLWIPVIPAERNYLTTWKLFSGRWRWWCQITLSSPRYLCSRTVLRMPEVSPEKSWQLSSWAQNSWAHKYHYFTFSHGKKKSFLFRESIFYTFKSYNIFNEEVVKKIKY